jgi:hypothetical protein
MGKIGFIFDIGDEMINSTFMGKKSNQKCILVFVEKEKIEGDFIVGFSSSFKPDKCEIVYLNKNLNFENYLVFDRPSFKYGKISLSQSTFVDYENLTFWFNSTKYRLLRGLFTLDNGDQTIDGLILTRIHDIISFL